MKVLFLSFIFSFFCILTHAELSQKEIKSCEIAILDLNDYLSKNSQDAFVEKLGNALNNHGFVLIKNHKISDSTTNSAYESAKQFFFNAN